MSDLVIGIFLNFPRASKGIGGAQSRILRSFPRICELETNTILITTRNIYRHGLKKQSLRSILPVLRDNGRILIVNDSYAVSKIPYFDQVVLGLQLARICRSKHIDVIHFVGNPLAPVVAKLLTKALIIQETTSPDHARNWRSALGKIAVRYVDGLMPVSVTVEKRLYECIGGECKGNKNIPISAAATCLPPPSLSAETHKQNIVVYPHRFLPRKNGTLFARAAKKALAECADWKVYVVGKDGPTKDRISIILKDTIESGQTVVGHYMCIESLLAKSKIVCGLIEPDNYPSQSIGEAMHFLNALLLSDTGESHTFLNGRNGHLVPLDEDKIAEALIAMMNNPNIENMGRASGEHLKHMLSIEKYTARNQEFYQTITRAKERNRSGEVK